MTQRPEDRPQIRYADKIREVLDALKDTYPPFSQNREEYLAGKHDHVAFRRNDFSIPLFIRALENAANEQNPRTWSEHGAEHKTYVSTLERLVEEFRRHPDNVQYLQGEYDRNDRYMPSPRLLLQTVEPIQGFQRKAVWAQLGEEIASRDHQTGGYKNRAKFLRRMAQEHGITFAVLSAFYADLDVPEIVNAFRDLSDVMAVPSQSRIQAFPDGKRFSDIQFLSHIRNILTHKNQMSFFPEKMRQAAEEIQKHPAWGNNSSEQVMGFGRFPVLFTPRVVLESYAFLIEDVAKAKGVNLENTGLAVTLAERTEGIWTSRVVTAYRMFAKNSGNILSPGNGASLREYLAEAGESED